MAHELKVADAVGKPGKVWNVGERQCRPPLPLEGTAGAVVGLASMDNRWDLKTYGTFSSEVPQSEMIEQIKPDSVVSHSKMVEQIEPAIAPLKDPFLP